MTILFQRGHPEAELFEKHRAGQVRLQDPPAGHLPQAVQASSGHLWSLKDMKLTVSRMKLMVDVIQFIMHKMHKTGELRL